MSLKDEIKRMTDAVFGSSDTNTSETFEESQVEESATTNEPTTDLPEEDLEGDEYNSDENFVTDSPSTSSPVTEEPEDEVATLNSKLAALQTKIDKLENPEPTQPPATDPPIEEQNFLDGLDPDELYSNPNALNTLLNNVYKQGILASRSEYSHKSNQLMQTMPGMVSNNIQVMQELQTMADNFYTENPDLVKYRDNVSTIFGQIVETNQDKNPNELLSLTADSVRETLGITKPNLKQPKKSPKLPKNRGNKRPSKTKPSSIESEIDAMNAALRA